MKFTPALMSFLALCAAILMALLTAVLLTWAGVSWLSGGVYAFLGLCGSNVAVHLARVSVHQWYKATT